MLADDPEDLTSKDFIQGVSSTITAALHQYLSSRIKAQTEKIRAAHEEALEKERTSFQLELRRLEQRLDGNRLDLETKVDGFESAARLRGQLVQLLEARPLDGGAAVYSPATAMVLRDLVQNAERLHEYCKQQMSEMMVEFSPRGLNGKEYPVTVGAFTAIGEVKRQLRCKYFKKSAVRICTQDGLVELQEGKLLMDYNLDQEFSIVLEDVLAANQLLHLPFTDARNLTLEAVSGRKCQVENPEGVHPICDGRCGVNIVDEGCIILDKPVRLGEEWTISVWTKTPIDATNPEFRNLVDAITPQGRIIVALVRGRLGNYTESKYIRGFNISKLSPGWHHIAVVGQKTRTTYYVDGKSLGVRSGCASGPIGVIGNARGCKEAWGTMSELAIYSIAADSLQVENLAAESLNEGDTWQEQVAALNRHEDSDSSSGGSITSRSSSAYTTWDDD
ncbi:unnamed protein product [Effrenium voratum]|nr:unnamed protein product [Effrenium voratum]